MALSGRDWTGLITLWATTGFAFSFVRWKQGRLTLPEFKLFEKKPKLRVLPDLPPKVEPKRAEPARAPALSKDATSEVDALLDKIAQSGIGSLTAQERARLESARAELLKRR
jgi:hypothetical protein